MQDFVIVTGMILQASPMGEYDRRVLVLTKERGKISAFAKGARRQNSKLTARTNPFCFGTFKLYEGKSSYNLVDAEITNYFDHFREDFEGAMYGMYFLDVADYYTRENNDEKTHLDSGGAATAFISIHAGIGASGYSQRAGALHI